jgi:signal transduction histidine kinase
MANATKPAEPRGAVAATWERVLARAKFHHVLFLAFTAIAALPVVLLAVWVERSAVEKEIEAAHDKHLLLARNAADALGRNAADAAALFRLAVANAAAGIVPAGTADALRAFHFHHVCVIGQGDKVESLLTTETGNPNAHIGAENFRRLRPLAEAGGGDVVFTDLRRYGEAPAIFLLQSLGGGRFGLGVLFTDHATKTQQAIAFGRKGHAAIVDRTGRVIAHPNRAWRAESRDLSTLPIVQRMIKGESGVMTFFSPAVKADMIAGFATVPGTGWGVMVPEPLSEIHERADDVRNAALGLAALGILLAALASWRLATRFAGPIEQVVETALGIAAGEPHRRVPPPPGHAPRELRQLAAMFNRMIDEIEIKQAQVRNAETSNSAKTQLLANMSHELRTPLNAILGFAAMIRASVLGPLGNERYRGYVDDIYASAEHLLKLINDLLDLSRAEAGKVETHIAETDIVRVCDFALRLVRQRAEQAGLALAIDLEPGLKRFATDEARLAQILLNLLSNAIKFTPRGGSVTLRVASVADGVAFRVVDTGVGIAKDDIPIALAPFGKVANPMAGRDEGSGLGLPLSKRLAENLGGRLEIESAPGRGTTVSVVLPHRSPTTAKIASAA